MYIKIMDICNMIITLLISLHMTSLQADPKPPGCPKISNMPEYNLTA